MAILRFLAHLGQSRSFLPMMYFRVTASLNAE